MRAVIQRVKRASVSVNGDIKGSIDSGLLVLLGVEHNDEYPDADYIIKKLSGLRIFEDAEGKMNLSLCDVLGSILVISQFTLSGDARRGNRPSFSNAAGRDKALPLYEYVINTLKKSFHVECGEFGADMDVELINSGPVTILLDSKKLF